jgi:glycosyltransferase involved in cell wall biosynthesis
VSGLAGRRVVHVTTTDMSLALLLGPQLRAFAAAGMDVVGVSAPGPWVEQLEAADIRHEPLRHATRAVAVGQDVLALGELVRLLRRLRPDIVHTHNPKPGLYGRVAARLAGVPVVVNTIHGLYATEDDRLMRRAAVYGIERFASMFSEAELVQNEEDVAVLRRLRIPARKLVLLGNGVDLGRFRPPADASTVTRARAALGAGADTVVVGLVGRLVWQKGLRELFDAAALLRPRCPDVAVVIIGPEDRDKGDALGPADIDVARAHGNVTFLGRRDDVGSSTTASTSSSCPRTARDSPARPWKQPPAPCPSSPPTSADAGRWSTTASPVCSCPSATPPLWPPPSRISPATPNAAGPWVAPAGPRPRPSSTTAGWWRRPWPSTSAS